MSTPETSTWIQPLSPEQLLSIADHWCAHTHAQVQDYSALVAACAVINAHIHGVNLHPNPRAAAQAFARCLKKLAPLSSGNEGFAELCARVLLELNESELH